MARRRRSYAFIRREMPNFEQMQAAGWNTPLFAYDDPRLQQQIARARAANVEFGIWGDPHGMGAEDFARHMAGLNQRYRPSVLVPDIEFQGKGYEGSPGWQYNQALARAWQQYLPGMETAITPMGNQHDFNYEAWKGIASEWLPQAYGANSNRGGQAFDPKQIADVLIARGVDPNLITPVLAAAHDPDMWNEYQGNTALWTYDDLASGLPQYYGPRGVLGERRAEDTDVGPNGARGDSPPRPPRLSQSAPMIQEGGLKWFGQNFQDVNAFRSALQQRGKSYDTWAKNHPTAARALGRRPAVRPRPTGRGRTE